MGSNPVQKQRRNFLLIGLVIGLIAGLIACGILYWYLTSKIDEKDSEVENLKQVAVLNKNVKSGDLITSADLSSQIVNANAVPVDAIGNVSGTAVAKIDLSSGTIISKSMLTTSDSKITKDLRQQEYNMIILPTQLSAGDYIDVRLQLPDGGDYIVISKKYVQKANTTTIWINMTEEELLIMGNAIIEYYIMTGSKLYATKYTDPGTQEAAIPTYVPNATVVDIINSELNGNISVLTEERYSEKLKSLRNSRIKSTLSKYDEGTQLSNIEGKIQEEIKSLKESRQAYFGNLNSVE